MSLRQGRQVSHPVAGVPGSNPQKYPHDNGLEGRNPLPGSADSHGTGLALHRSSSGLAHLVPETGKFR